MKAIKENPVLFQGAILGLVAAALLLLTQFGVQLTDGQQAAISTFVGALFVVWLFLIRAQVTPAVLVVARATDDGPIAGAASPLPDGIPVTVAVQPQGGVIPNVPANDVDGDGHDDTNGRFV